MKKRNTCRKPPGDIWRDAMRKDSELIRDIARIEIANGGVEISRPH